MDLNAPDVGTAYLPQYQDPTAPGSAIPGARALPTDLFRPYRSVQTSFNRCFRNGWQGGVNWTLSLRHKGNTFSPKHLQHNADGTICLRPEQDAVDDVLSYNNPAAATITNNQFNADGSVNTARLSPATAGAGAATGAQAMRSVQMQIRFTF